MRAGRVAAFAFATEEATVTRRERQLAAALVAHGAASRRAPAGRLESRRAAGLGSGAGPRAPDPPLLLLGLLGRPRWPAWPAPGAGRESGSAGERPSTSRGRGIRPPQRPHPGRAIPPPGGSG